MNRPFRVGHNCQAWCTKCKGETEHVIVALMDSIPKRVECCSCGGQHNYRMPAGALPPARSRKPAGQTSKKKVRGRSWQALMAATEEPSRAYAISASFQEGEYLEHPRFGRGIVQKVIPGGKIQVLFEQGPSLLVHER